MCPFPDPWCATPTVCAAAGSEGWAGGSELLQTCALDGGRNAQSANSSAELPDEPTWSVAPLFAVIRSCLGPPQCSNPEFGSGTNSIRCEKGNVRPLAAVQRRLFILL